MAGRFGIDTVTLDREARYRRRVAMTTDQGHAFLLDLPEATYLADGDALEIEGRGLVKVVAAVEDLLEVHAASREALARIAWHIGNRHTPAEITADALYIQPDHVLQDMVIGLGAHVHRVRRPFEPEGGAYAQGGTAHGHDHSHAHEPVSAATPAQPVHQHGPGCGHDHHGDHKHEH